VDTFTNMERLDKKYAIVYIDRDGEWIECDNFSDNSIISDYYELPGPMQWNFYYIVPESKIGEHTKEEIEAEQHYTRKFVIPDDQIDSFIKERFPDMGETHGTIEIIKGKNYVDACNKARDAKKEKLYNCIIESPYRDKSMMDTLVEFDSLRADLIRNPGQEVLLYTHFSDEHFLARKKFHFLCPAELEKQKQTTE
jgi:hypothetical protein